MSPLRFASFLLTIFLIGGVMLASVQKPTPPEPLKLPIVEVKPLLPAALTTDPELAKQS
ncbi:hypothetical protein N4R57_03935 [Rhodobacteraceae bacterium D3-12]|nr:hypothetical protein N4R57_03935 [Rhodobacteraceae bacterium D3-12]